MADKYSNVISFYCFATKLIGVTEEVNYMMSNYNIELAVHSSNTLLNYLQNRKKLLGPIIHLSHIADRFMIG